MHRTNSRDPPTSLRYRGVLKSDGSLIAERPNGGSLACRRFLSGSRTVLVCFDCSDLIRPESSTSKNRYRMPRRSDLTDVLPVVSSVLAFLVDVITVGIEFFDSQRGPGLTEKPISPSEDEQAVSRLVLHLRSGPSFGRALWPRFRCSCKRHRDSRYFGRRIGP
jgi:hypothetical protein